MAEPLSLVRASLWAATWAIGVAIGVALGGWLTVVGSAAAPGVAALDLTEDLVVLPLAAAGVTFVIHLTGQAIAHVIRGRGSRSSSDGHDGDQRAQESENDQVSW